MQKEIPSTEVETTPAPTDVPEETTPQDTPDNEQGEDTTKDPFDAIEDPVLRAEAKKYRGIASRKERKQETSGDDSKYVTREEIYKQNREEAARLVTEITGDDDPDAEMKQALNDNWDDVMTYYVSRHGQNKAEDIVKDVRAAYILWQHETGGVKSDDSARNLQTTTGGQPTGGGQKPKSTGADTGDDPRFSKPKKPEEWYPKGE